MDGRLSTVLLTLALPATLIGVTVTQFGSNPLAIVGLLTIMVAGVLFLLSYTDTF